MVSNARLDLPDPERPVTTIRRSRGISTEIFLRLCTRAPCTAIVVRGADFVRLRFPFLSVSEDIRGLRHGEECELLHLEIALLRELDGRRRLADDPPVRQVFASRDHAPHVEVSLE